jgi:hypothetical protein
MCGQALWEFDDCTRKGKPAVRWGHKAVSLRGATIQLRWRLDARDCLAAEGDRRKLTARFPLERQAGRRPGHLPESTGADFRRTAQEGLRPEPEPRTGITFWSSSFPNPPTHLLQTPPTIRVSLYGRCFKARARLRAALLRTYRQFPSSHLRHPLGAGTTDKGTPTAMWVRKARSLGEGLPRSSGYRRSVILCLIQRYLWPNLGLLRTHNL